MKIVQMIGCCDLNLKFLTKVLARLKGLSWERTQAFEQIQEDENTWSENVWEWKACAPKTLKLHFDFGHWK